MSLKVAEHSEKQKKNHMKDHVGSRGFIFPSCLGTGASTVVFVLRPFPGLCHKAAWRIYRAMLLKLYLALLVKKPVSCREMGSWTTAPLNNKHDNFFGSVGRWNQINFSMLIFYHSAFTKLTSAQGGIHFSYF